MDAQRFGGDCEASRLPVCSLIGLGSPEDRRSMTSLLSMTLFTTVGTRMYLGTSSDDMPSDFAVTTRSVWAYPFCVIHGAALVAYSFRIFSFKIERHTCANDKENCCGSLENMPETTRSQSPRQNGGCLVVFSEMRIRVSSAEGQNVENLRINQATSTGSGASIGRLLRIPTYLHSIIPAHLLNARYSA